VPSLRIIYDVDGWAHHHKARALQKYAPADFDVSIAPFRHPQGADADAALGTERVDLVLLLREVQTRPIAEALQRRHWDSKLVVGWSCGFPRQLGFFYSVRGHADAWIFNNRECWEGSGRLPHTYLLANGVDLDTFTVTQPLAQRRPKVLWVGSERYRRTKGYDDLLLPVQERLQARGIPCDLLLVDSYGPHKRTPDEMAEWYNTGTVLVCASESEGTPNPALEAAACGCTVVSTRVGNMAELIRDDVNGYLVERDVDALAAAAERACAAHARLAARMQEDIRAWHWAERSADYFQLFRDVVEGRDAPPPRAADLSRDVTVFVTTVGTATVNTCLTHLREQDCTFTLQVIDRVAPMDAAFQRMLDECRTPYYVQVDEDMLLYPHAVRTLYEAMVAAAPEVAIIAADLYDVHLAHCIIGVKIYRHDIVRRYPFRSMDAFEVDQVLRFEADGYTLLRPVAGMAPVARQTLGVHGTHWTPTSIYERYANLERRRRLYPARMPWFRRYAAVFLQRFIDDPTELNFFALMGVIAGTLAHPVAAAKDYRTYGNQHGFDLLREWFDELQPRGAADDAADGSGEPDSLLSRSSDVVLTD
jgi:hypothetical protein